MPTIANLYFLFSLNLRSIISIIFFRVLLSGFFVIGNCLDALPLTKGTISASWMFSEIVSASSAFGNIRTSEGISGILILMKRKNSRRPQETPSDSS